MDHLNYKERFEALRRAGFTTLEIERLIQFRRVWLITAQTSTSR